jgi:hypothetical protein
MNVTFLLEQIYNTFNMIKQHDPNINPDDFIYKTKFTFGTDLGKEFLAQIDNDLLMGASYSTEGLTIDGMTMAKVRELRRRVGQDKTKELVRRQHQVISKFPGENLIEFKQYHCGPEWNAKVLDITPDWLKEIGPNEPNPMLQISKCDGGSGILPPHCGHKRTASMFMLLQGGGQETRWWTPTADFETISELRIPDLDRIQLAVSAVIEPGVWYVFDHMFWHSVHKSAQKGLDRITLCLDFYSITAPDLVKLCKQHGG